MKSDKIIGLNEIEVKKNQDLHGLNELKQNKRRNFFIIFIHEFGDWLVIILIISAIINLLIDKKALFETIIILSILFVNATIGTIQEIKAYKTLDGLKKLSNHKVKVIRAGFTTLIEPKYLTIDDIVVLEKGNLVDADISVIESNNLSLDESILTGESVSVYKNINDLLYSGTFVLSGSCIGKVVKIGMKTKLGTIANEIISVKEETTPLEEKLEQIGKMIGLIAIAICILVFVLELLLSIPLLVAFKSAISLAVAAIPEGLATVVTVCLAIGVGKMAKENAIIKRLSSVETLGCSNIVCTDKTGTLTENKLKIVNIFENRIYQRNELFNLSYLFKDYLYILSKETQDVIDPIDKGIIEVLDEMNYRDVKYELISIEEFNSVKKYMKMNVKYNGNIITLYKGAFETLSSIVKTKPNVEYVKTNDMMAEKGYRVITIATEEKIIGLIGMQDLPRKDVIHTIAKANTAGIKTIMITGDHAKTAYYIASQLNIAKSMEEVITKKELDNLTDKELDSKIQNYCVYARVDPIDKVRIVKAWQRKNMVVAMTGDGINDAPALKKADIGCAMGSGAEISKECADIILVDSNYNTIIKAVKNGRSIYQNIRKCCKYLLSSNIGEVLSILIVMMISLITGHNLGLPLLAIHLLWINVITDSLPAFGIATLNASDSVMKNKPRKKEGNFFDKKITKDILFMGVIIGLLTVVSFLIGLRLKPIYAQTMAFLTISTSQLIHSFNCSTEQSIFKENVLKNVFLTISFIVGMVLQFVVIYIDKVNDLFALEPLPFMYLFIAILLAFIVVLVSEFKKKIENKKNN